jgi:hypothetical protein
MCEGALQNFPQKNVAHGIANNETILWFFAAYAVPRKLK